MLIAALGTFAVFFGISLTVQGKFRYTYYQKYTAFACWYIVGISGLAYLYIAVDAIFLFLLLCCASTYLLWTYQFRVRYPDGLLFARQTVPSEWQPMTRPKVRDALVKVTEVLLQDVCAFLIVLGLVALGWTYLAVTAAFVCIVALIHVPGIRLFGPYYGGYFLVMSTSLAPVLVYLTTFGALGLVGIFAIHLAGYIVLYECIAFLSRPNLR